MMHFLQSFVVVYIVFALEKYLILLYNGYGCLVGFYTLLFKHKFNKSVCCGVCKFLLLILVTM
jgi:hypothetical protein